MSAGSSSSAPIAAPDHNRSGLEMLNKLLADGHLTVASWLSLYEANTDISSRQATAIQAYTALKGKEGFDAFTAHVLTRAMGLG